MVAFFKLSRERFRSAVLSPLDGTLLPRFGAAANILIGKVTIGKVTMPVAVAGTIMAAALLAMPVEITRAGNLAAESLTALMQRRSPGLRSTGNLSDTKARHQHVAARGFSPAAPENPFIAKIAPVARALPSNLAGSELLAPLHAALLPDVLTSDGGGNDAALLGGIAAPGANFLPAIILGGGGSSGGGGGGGGSGGGGGGGPTVIPGAPVPEPTTWFMLVVGFGITGFFTRARRQKPACVSAATPR
jgi:PEP-CTERM motif